jgi:hypothetical protein
LNPYLKTTFTKRASRAAKVAIKSVHSSIKTSTLSRKPNTFGNMSTPEIMNGGKRILPAADD